MQDDIKQDIKEIKDDIREINSNFSRHEDWEEGFLKNAFEIQKKLIENSEKNLIEWNAQKELNKILNIKINISLFCISFIYVILMLAYIWKI